MLALNEAYEAKVQLEMYASFSSLPFISLNRLKAIF